MLTDLRLPDGEGIELARELPPADAPELIVVTGHATVDSAVAALRAGATDYLVKPAELDRVQAVLRHARKTAALRSEIGALRHELRRLGRFGRLLGSAPAMQLLYDQLGRVAPTSATVLLLGESGTGKELAALTLHELSRRREAPFLPLNCGAVVGAADRKRAVRPRARQLHRRGSACTRASSSAPMAAACSWMKSPKCRWSCR